MTIKLAPDDEFTSTDMNNIDFKPKMMNKGVIFQKISTKIWSYLTYQDKVIIQLEGNYYTIILKH